MALATPVILKHDLRQLTIGQHKTLLTWYMKQPLLELRRRQDINTVQTEDAHKNPDRLGVSVAISNLQITRDLLDEAVLLSTN